MWKVVTFAVKNYQKFATRLAQRLTSAGSCPPPAQLIQAIDPEIAAAFPEVFMHVRGCRTCRARLDAIARMIEEIRSVDPNTEVGNDISSERIDGPPGRWVH